MENVLSFGAYSSFPVYAINTEFGFPKKLLSYKFEIIVLHYSLFGRGNEYELSTAFYDYLKNSQGVRIAFFQDEYRYCQKRFGFINEFGIDTVYTCVEQQYHHLVYGKYTSANHIFTYIPGYVSSALPGIAEKFKIPFEQREIDVGYRARRLAYYMGKEAQEKHTIGLEFSERCRKAGLQLSLDIDVEESGRIYGDNWYRFIANCKGMLGVESGVSIFDLNDEVRTACDAIIAREPNITFEEVFDRLLYKWENNVPLRTISPRHFEAAAFGVSQILFEGSYSGILQPDVHYIPLKKDFSNFSEVVDKFKDRHLTTEMTSRANADLIASQAYSYERFVQLFDSHLKALGLNPPSEVDDRVATALRRADSLQKVNFLVTKLKKKLTP